MQSLLEREPGNTNPAYGCAPERRPLAELLDFGILVIDKPPGPTSHQVSAYVQSILGIDKAGHSGTLDPNVTGVLPIATGRATRLLETLLRAGKTYVGVMHLHEDYPEYVIRKHAEHFIGTITQLPPKRSSVARRLRERTVYDLRFLEVRGRDVLFSADVQAGTYLRKLCHDFGETLGGGAHMAELRRTRAAHYEENRAITLQQLRDLYDTARDGNEGPLREVLLPGEHSTAPLARVLVHDSAVHSITQGSTLKVPGISAVSPDIAVGDTVQLLTLKNELIALGTARMTSEDMLGSTGIAVKPEKVVLRPDAYPRMTETRKRL